MNYIGLMMNVMGAFSDKRNKYILLKAETVTGFSRVMNCIEGMLVIFVALPIDIAWRYAFYPLVRASFRWSSPPVSNE
jgi:hypothetical protein